MGKYTVVTKNKKDFYENKFFPKKWLGQHFLLDENIRDKIIKAASLTPNDILIEIGPGKVLTGIIRRISRNFNHFIINEVSDIDILKNEI